MNEKIEPHHRSRLARIIHELAANRWKWLALR